MRGYLPLIGVCMLLVASKVAAQESKKPLFDIFHKNAGGADDFESEDTEGSGNNNILINTHEDDEDSLEMFSGDHSNDKHIKVTVPHDDDEPYDMDFNNAHDKDLHMGHSDDEDLYELSGSGDDTDDKGMVVMPTTPSKPLTSCENLRNAARHSSGFVPECDDFGGYKKQQCTVDSVNKKKFCWCVNPEGTVIAGTKLLYPKTPDCDFGTNLTTCVFQLVQHSAGQLGSYQPRCTDSGDYEPMQCHEAECWCVDFLGNEISTPIMGRPVCKDITKEPTIKKATTAKPLNVNPDTGYDVVDDSKDETDVVVNIGPEIPIDPIDEDYEEDTNNLSGDNDGLYAPTKHSDAILAQPGLLAAIIGGSVVLLLVFALLVMFIVYRMRKKDEGSYQLDEQKYQNYSYQKAPDKEFYA